MKKNRVIQLTNKISSTSSPWVNFYPNFRRVTPGALYPPIEVDGRSSKKVVCSWGRLGAERRKFYKAGILPAAMFLLKISKLRSRLLIVHVHAPLCVIVVLLSRFLGAKCKVTISQHNRWDGFRWRHKLFFLIASRFVESYICCSESVRESLPPYLVSSLEKRKRLAVIANGVPDSLAVWNRKREQFLYSQSDFSSLGTVVVAKMAPQKNCIKLIELISALPELGNVVWYGDGPLREKIYGEVEKLELQTRIEFKGVVEREEVYKALSRSLFYVNISLWEGLSVADLEAAAIGVMPLLSDIPERKVIAEVAELNLLNVEDSDRWRNTIRGTRNQTLAQEAIRSRALSKAILAKFALESSVVAYSTIHQSIGR